MYPNYGVFSPDGKKGVIFSHGHYLESLYSLVSKLKTAFFPDSKIPDEIYELEKENFAWIDFFWSTMGRQGAAGQGVEVIYKSFQEPDRLATLLTNFIVSQMHIGRTLGAVEAPIIKQVVKALIEVIESRERSLVTDAEETTALSQEGEDGLGDYMAHAVRNQLLKERSSIPENLALVIGHTHKPFEEERPFVGYPRDVDVFNTGGWVVETEKESTDIK
jgi:hypothetical protein